MPQPPEKTGSTKQEEGEASTPAIQFLAFKIDNEEYGVDINAVREIKGWIPATRLPNAPRYVRGVINLRGLMVPVYDLRARFGGGETEITRTHVVIIVKVKERIFGVLVDGVSDILTVTEDQIKPAPDMGRAVDSGYLRGLISINDRLVALLALDRLFPIGEIEDGNIAALASA
jgi:purine-binding chemotaxis protein CheW